MLARSLPAASPRPSLPAALPRLSRPSSSRALAVALARLRPSSALFLSPIPILSSLASPSSSSVRSIPCCKSLLSARSYASASYPPHNVMDMPALSPTMTQGNLGKWHKAVGDKIAPGDILVEIETDKAQMDFECQEDGFIAKIIVPDGTKDVAVGTPIAITVEDKDDIPKFAAFTIVPTASSDAAAADANLAGAVKAAAAAAAAAADAAAPAAAVAATAAPPAAASSSDRIFASPIAKSLAAEHGISLSSINGSGPNGRIVKDDVEKARSAARAPTTTSTVASKSTKTAPVAQPAPGAAFTDTPLSNIRKVIASRLTESKSTIPHFYLTIQLDAGKILKLRETLNKEGNGLFKLSVNDFVIKAASLALKDVPAVNSAWQDSFIRQFHSADIAVAVATDSGLITPIVRAAESKGLSAISNSVKDLAEKARAGKLAPSEYQGGSFTISNLGMYGIQHFTAIINPPHSAILAVGGLEDKLVLDESQPKGFRVQKSMHVSLSSDHRVVDGAVGAQWLQRFKHYFENPLSMLL